MPRERYLDWNSTAPLLPQAAETMARAAGHLWGNPSSVHAAGRRARDVLEATREQLATLTGFHPRDVVFTSGGTEANNLALAGARRLLLSRLEHPSVTQVAERLAAKGASVTWLPIAPSGVLLPQTVAEALDGLQQLDGTVVCAMAANHETGVVQPIEQIAQVCAGAGVRLHVDAVQWIGKAVGPAANAAVSVPETNLVASLRGADSVSVASHKLRGPKGIGALLFRGAPPEPALLGGAQERGLRPGTQDALLALGFSVALDHLQGAAQRWSRVAPLRDQLERRLSRVAQVNGADAPRLVHVSNLSFTNIAGPELVAALDLAGIRVSSGSACSAGTTEPSKVIAAVWGDDRAQGAVRFSLGEQVRPDDIDAVEDVVLRVLGR